MAIINCQKCGKPISDQSSTCVHCGEKVLKPEQMITCPECNTQIELSAAVCPVCGYPIKPDGTKTKKKVVKMNRKMVIIIAIVAAILATALAVIVPMVRGIIAEREAQAQEMAKLEAYAEVVDKIYANQDGARRLWEKSKEDPELREYILVNLEDSAIELLYKENNGWHVSDIYHLIDDVLDVGMDKVSLAKLEILIEDYMRYRDLDMDKVPMVLEQIEKLHAEGAYDEIRQYVDDVRSGKIYTGDPREDIKEYILERAESKIRSMLKDPDSYKRSYFNYSVDLDEETGEFHASIVVTYTATNSFGGRVTDVYTLSYDGTIIDGKITIGG